MSGATINTHSHSQVYHMNNQILPGNKVEGIPGSERCDSRFHPYSVPHKRAENETWNSRQQNGFITNMQQGTLPGQYQTWRGRGNRRGGRLVSRGSWGPARGVPRYQGQMAPNGGPWSPPRPPLGAPSMSPHGAPMGRFPQSYHPLSPPHVPARPSQPPEYMTHAHRRGQNGPQRMVGAVHRGMDRRPQRGMAHFSPPCAQITPSLVDDTGKNFPQPAAQPELPSPSPVMPPSPASTGSPPTQSSLIVMETESVSTVGSTSIQTQSTVSASIVTNSVQPLNDSLTKSALSPTKPEIVTYDLTDLPDNNSNDAETSSKIDTMTTNMKIMQNENGQPTTVYRYVTLNPGFNKSDPLTVVGSVKPKEGTIGAARSICSRAHVHTGSITSGTTTLFPCATNIFGGTNEILVHVPSTHGPPTCVPGRVIPCQKHAHIRAPCPEKYKNKGINTKNPIVIDSDDEGEEQMEEAPSTCTVVDPPPDSPIKKITVMQNPAALIQNNDPVDHDSPPKMFSSPYKRAKMSAAPHTMVPSSTSSVSATSMATTTLATTTTVSSELDFHEASQFLGRLIQDRENSVSSSSSGDSLSSLSSVGSTTPPIEESLVALTPKLLDQMLKKAQENRPYKRLRTTAKNLFTVAKTCNIGKVIALLAEGTSPNQQISAERGKTAMHAAAAGGHVDIIKAFRRLVNADLNVTDYEMRTPLFDAVENHKIKAVEYLIENGADLTVKDENGMTCLHAAARRGYTDLLTLLLTTYKFDIDEKDNGGWTPIMWAAEDKHIDATRCLTENGASVHLRDEELNIPLHWAALAGSLDVMDLLLKKGSDIHSVNQHGDTALHIAARENNLSCVRLLLDRGTEIDIRNKNKDSPVDVCVPDSPVFKLLNAKHQLTACQGNKRKFRLLCSDISRGQENVVIPCINEIDDEPFPDCFHFVKASVETSNSLIDRNVSRMKCCDCKDSCRTNTCACAVQNEKERIWFTEDRRLVNEIHKLDRPLVYECNKMCKCWSYCRNRVVQRGVQHPLQLFKTESKGWGVKALSDITQGSFVCEYTGELISDEEAETRDDDTYLFDLDCKEYDQELCCIDAKKYGNISRFINHSCEHNVVPVRVFVDHQDIRFPRICFFACKDIEKNDEICFDYGDKFWDVKKDVFCCSCGNKTCRYRESPNS